VCRRELARSGDGLACTGCAARYPIARDIPILLRDPSIAETEHEGDLPARPIYSAWKERLILKALTDAQVALDFGAGRQVFDDPNIVKLDIIFDSTLDAVGDLHELPFRDNSIDFAFGGAVMEHIADPARAIAELYRVIRPGGYIYADWSFMTAYHGYPHHYSNVTIQGIRGAFKAFTCLETGVGPHLAPSFALRSVLATYQQHFTPRTRLDRELMRLIDRVLWHPLDEQDACIPREDWFRIAAGVYFFGVKQPNGDDAILPPPVLDAWRSDAALQRRFPQPLNVAVPDNLMAWAFAEGRETYPAIRAWLDHVRPFVKSGGPPVPRPLRDWPNELIETVVHEPVNEERRRVALWFSRPFRARLLESWEQRGLLGVVHCVWMSAVRTWQRGGRLLRRLSSRSGA
jgi:SAM-dependent methyltransferase